MADKIDITIENKLSAGERDVNVFHLSSNTRSAHIISFNSAITLPLRHPGESDYLLISVLRGPGYLWTDCVISLPSWIDFNLSSEGKLGLTHSGDTERMWLKMPPGPPTWELKITRPHGRSSVGSESTVDASIVVSIQDHEPGGGEKK